MKLQEKITYCRKKAGLSQEALAEKMDVSRQAISKWETGDAVPEVGKLKLLATVFGVTTDWLLSEDEPPELGYTEAPQEKSAQTQPRRQNMKNNFSHYFKQYGWVLGIIPIILGVLMKIEGVVFLIASNAMVNTFNESVSSMQNEFYSSLPNIWYATGSSFPAATPDVSGISAVPNIIGVAILVFGIVLTIGGIVLTVILKKRSKNI